MHKQQKPKEIFLIWEVASYATLNEELLEYIKVKILEVGNFKFDVLYSTLPNACFDCHGQGHIVCQYCPNKPQNSTTNHVLAKMAPVKNIEKDKQKVIAKG